MKRPTQIMAFDALYAIVAGEGREEALFGRSIEVARPIFQKTLIGDGYPSAYLEFPLLGTPRFDLLSVYGNVKPGARFASGAGFGYQAMFDWFSTVRSDDVGCGLEMDCGDGETERAGVYLQQRTHTELVEPFLESIGEKERASGYLAQLDRMPSGWPPSYVGLFPGRPGTPLRIGGYMAAETQAQCATDPAFLASQFDRIGYSAYTDDMLARCCTILSLAPAVDFQFDILPDGSLGDVFGLSLSFNKTKPLSAHACMEDGYGARICSTLQEWGLADDRWRRIAGAAFARHVPFEREDGSEGRFALCCLFNYAKVKFKAGEPQPAKFYLMMEWGELDE